MKKGQGSLIAWVLLIGFAVTLAVFVGRWSLQQSERSTETFEKIIMGDLSCSDIQIDATCEGLIKNRGNLRVSEVRIIQDGQIKPCNSINKEDPLMPKDERNCGSFSGEIKIMPIIYVDDKKIGCNNREKVLADC